MAAGNPGKDTAAHSGSVIVTGPSQTTDATAADIMMRWSPWCSTLPPLRRSTPRMMQPSSVPSASPPRALIMRTVVSMRSLSLNLSWGAPYSLLSPSAVLSSTAVTGNGSGT